MSKVNIPEEVEKVRKKGIVPLVILVVVMFLALAFRPFVIIPAGHRGVVFNTLRGGVDTKRSLGEGLHFIMPLVDLVENVEVRVKKASFQAAAASQDLQEVKAQLVINYHLDPSKVAQIYQEVGLDYESKLITPSVEESIKSVTAQFNATQLIANRTQVKDLVLQVLKDRLDKYNIIVDDVSITDFQFTEEFAKAIEAKQIAEQKALKKKYELDEARKQAEIDVAQAEGEKNATITRAEGQAEANRLLMKSVNQEVIKLKELEVQAETIKKWDGKLPTVTGGAMPMFNVGTTPGH